MYIKTQTQYTAFENDELTEIISKIDFKINNFGLWCSDHDTKASYISNDIEIVYYKDGGSKTIIGNREYECPKGSFLIIQPNVLNTSINEGFGKYSYYYFHFDIEPIYLKEQLLSLLTKHGNVIYKDEIQDFHEMLERLLNESINKEIGYSSIITSGLLRIIVQIIRAQLKRVQDSDIEIIHSPYINLVNDTIIYIQSHLYEAIRLKNLAQHMGVSISLLNKAFVNVLNIPPASYIQQQKIQYAQRELMKNKTLIEISQELGYSSAYHLSKSFKNITGMSPKEYKKTFKI